MNSLFSCFSWEKSTNFSQNPGLANEFSTTPRGRLDWTGPIANSSDQCIAKFRAVKSVSYLVAPYCAIPRDYLSDTPLLRAMGFLVSQHGQLGAIPPPPFLSVSLLESMRSGGAIPPPQKGYLSDTCAIPYENEANGCDTPLCDTILKGSCVIWGAISLWAAKCS